jgi:hypothetical protein
MSRFPPGLRVSVEANRAAALKWLGNENFYFVEKFGRNDGIADGTYETIMLEGSYPAGPAPERAGIGWLGSGATLYLSSRDAVVNNGFVVTIQGLDENGDQQSADATVNGQNGVVFPGTWDRVFRAWVSNTSIGNITGIIGGSSLRNIYVGNEIAPVVGVPAGSNTYAIIDAAYPISPNQTEMACYTIPRGYRGYITSYAAAVVNLGNPANDAVVDILVQTSEFSLPDPTDLGSGTYEPFRTRDFMSVSSRATSMSHKPLDGVIAVSELGDIRMVGAPSGNAEVFGTFSLLVVKND